MNYVNNSKILFLVSCGIDFAIYTNERLIDVFTSLRESPSDSAISLFDSSFGKPTPNLFFLCLL